EVDLLAVCNNAERPFPLALLAVEGPEIDMVEVCGRQLDPGDHFEIGMCAVAEVVALDQAYAFHDRTGRIPELLIVDQMPRHSGCMLVTEPIADDIVLRHQQLEFAAAPDRPPQHSLPTRRSSDLEVDLLAVCNNAERPFPLALPAVEGPEIDAVAEVELRLKDPGDHFEIAMCAVAEEIALDQAYGFHHRTGRIPELLILDQMPRRAELSVVTEQMPDDFALRHQQFEIAHVAERTLNEIAVARRHDYLLRKVALGNPVRQVTHLEPNLFHEPRKDF